MSRQYLTKWEILASGRSKGFHVLAGYLRLFDSGQMPRTPATEKLAEDFRTLIGKKDAKPAQVLELVRVRGKARTTQQRDARVCDFIGTYLETDSGRGAISRAYKAAEKKFRRDRRQMQQIWLRNKWAWHYQRAVAKEHRRFQRSLAPTRDMMRDIERSLAWMRDMQRRLEERARLEHAVLNKGPREGQTSQSIYED